MYLTLKQCSELTDINISTCRYYKDTYLPYFNTQGEGKTTKFEKDSTIEILNIIKASYAKKMDHDQIIDILEKRYGVVVDLVTQGPGNNTETTQQEDLVQSLKVIILDLQEELADIKQTLLKQDERNEDGDRRAEARDNEVLQKLNDIKMIQQQRNKKPWWRFFDK